MIRGSSTFWKYSIPVDILVWSFKQHKRLKFERKIKVLINYDSFMILVCYTLRRSIEQADVKGKL